MKVIVLALALILGMMMGCVLEDTNYKIVNLPSSPDGKYEFTNITTPKHVSLGVVDYYHIGRKGTNYVEDRLIPDEEAKAIGNFLTIGPERVIEVQTSGGGGQIKAILNGTRGVKINLPYFQKGKVSKFYMVLRTDMEELTYAPAMQDWQKFVTITLSNLQKTTWGAQKTR